MKDILVYAITAVFGGTFVVLTGLIVHAYIVAVHSSQPITPEQQAQRRRSLDTSPYERYYEGDTCAVCGHRVGDCSCEWTDDELFAPAPDQRTRNDKHANDAA